LRQTRIAPLVQKAPAAHSVSSAHVAAQAPLEPLVTHLNGAHDCSAPPLHAPPLQSCPWTLTPFIVQTVGPQLWLFGANARQSPESLQRPSGPHEGPVGFGQRFLGSVPPAMMPQTPSPPEPLSAPVHARHSSSSQPAVSQHTPSSHDKLEAHSRQLDPVKQLLAALHGTD
jgi:hypothetical protein